MHRVGRRWQRVPCHWPPRPACCCTAHATHTRCCCEAGEGQGCCRRGAHWLAALWVLLCAVVLRVVRHSQGRKACGHTRAWHMQGGGRLLLLLYRIVPTP